MRRYICARDLHEKPQRVPLFQNLTEAKTKIVDDLLKRLSPSQQAAFEHVHDTKHDIVFIQGPPGTGKTTFIVTLLQIFWHCGYSLLACAPSNSATDHLATVLEKACPEMAAIRYHAYERETGAIRRQEQEFADENETTEKPAAKPSEKSSAKPSDKSSDKPSNKTADKTSDKPDFDDPQAAEENRIFCQYLSEIQENDLEWKGKLARPNFKNMSLHARAMQNAGLVPHDLKCFAIPPDDPHAEFRRCLRNRDHGRDKSEEEKENYKRCEDELMVDTIRKGGCVVTTLSKAADNKLRQAKKPVVAFIDEACQSTELEALLVWAHNTETLLLLIFLGDPKQLRATVKSFGRNTDVELMNPFADQMIISFFERLWSRGFKTFMLTEQFRLAEGLEEVFSERFYDSKITNAESTKNRPEAKKVIDFIIKHYGVTDNIPHVCLNVADGVCLRGEMQSRYNLHNIVATVHAIRKIFADKLWTESQISVITPYRLQAAKYRQVFNHLKWFKIQVFTVDSVQGQENQCTIFDIVLSYTRNGGWGFVKEGPRLNVALSRSINHFIFVCDLAALNPNKAHLRQLEELDEEARELRKSTDREISKHLRGVLNYFERKRITYLIKAESLNDISLVDMTPVIEFRRRNTCHNCHQIGHKKMDCPEVTCHNCQKKGHISFRCTDPVKQKPRKGCGLR